MRGCPCLADFCHVAISGETMLAAIMLFADVLCTCQTIQNTHERLSPSQPDSVLHDHYEPVWGEPYWWPS